MTTDISRSNWWYGVAILAVLAVLGWVGLHVLVEMGLFDGEQALSTLIVPAISLTLAYVLTPLFALSLLMDAKRISASEAGWNPFLWGGLSLLTFVGLVSPYSLLIPVAAVYLYRRRKRTNYVYFK